MRNCVPCVKQCTGEDRRIAKRVSVEIAKAINNMGEDLSGSIAKFVSKFSPTGLYSTAINATVAPYFRQSNFYGRDNIRDYLIRLYGPAALSTNQSVVIKKSYWDCKTRTLGVQRTYHATNNTADRTFAYAQPSFGTPAVVLQPGNKYSQDQFVCFKFDCDYKIVFYREYFDATQFISTYNDDYPDVWDKDELACGITPCSPEDRARATQIVNKINFLFELGGTTFYTEPTDQTLAALSGDEFGLLFNKLGIWSTSINPLEYTQVPQPPENSTFTGPSEIAAFAKSYTTMPQETNQTLTNVSVNWDGKNRTIMLQLKWYSRIQEGFTRTFGNGTDNTLTLLGGDIYYQDDFHVIRFDTNYKLVYYNEYFDHNQYETTYPKVADNPSTGQPGFELVQPVCSST